MQNIIHRQELTPISDEEVEVVNDIRKVNFGKVTIFIQDGSIVSKEVTITIKNNKRKNGNGNDNNGNGDNFNSLRRIEKMPERIS